MGGAALLTITGLILSSSIWETNKRGFFQVKQAFYTGTMTVRNAPGTYGQMFGDIKTYSIPGILYFSSDAQDKDDRSHNSLQTPISVTFNGASTAKVSGVLKYRLPSKPTLQFALDREYGSDYAVKNQLVRQAVTEALQQTAPLMTAEEAYASKRALFKSVSESQLKQGIFKKKTSRVTRTDPNDPTGKKKVTDTVVQLVKNKNGNPIIGVASVLKDYGIEIIQFTLKDIDFDAKTDELIAKKKETQMLKVLSEAEGQKAMQDAIKAVEQGKAKVATAEAEALVLKKTKVIAAQRKFEVAEFEKKQAKEEAQARLIKQKAEADANKLLVKAGLTPQEKAEWEYKRIVGVAEQLSKIKFPGMMILGGGGKGNSPMNPFDAVGLDAFIKIQKSMSATK